MESRKLRYTKSAIRESLIALLRQKPIEAISVTELCRLADINRTTFYRHYTDLFDLMEKTESELCEELYRTLRIQERDTQYDVVLRALSSVRRNREMYRILFRQREDGGFVARLIAPAYALMREQSAHVAWDAALSQMEYDFLIGGITSIWRSWLNGNCEQPPERVARLIDLLIESSFGCFIRAKE